MNYPIHCEESRQNCATPWQCTPACRLIEINCSGRTIANGRAVDYAGKEAEEPADPPAPRTILQDLAANLKWMATSLLLLLAASFIAGIAAGFFHH